MRRRLRGPDDGDLVLTRMGATIDARMGLNPWAAFYGSDADAVVAGDVAMRAGRALRYFLHYWGRGPARELAAGVRAAVDQTAKRASAGR